MSKTRGYFGVSMTRLLSKAVLLYSVLSLAAVAQAAPATLRTGTRIVLVTAESLTSKTHAKGDMVSLRTSEDVRADGQLVVPAGTPAVGQVADARGAGGLGVSGKLVLRPLYLRIGDRTVRLRGFMDDKGKVGADGVLGVALFAVTTGRSAEIDAGAKLIAEVEKDVTIEPAAGSPQR